MISKIFKRKSIQNIKDYMLIVEIVNALPKKYERLRRHLNKKYVVGVINDPYLGENWKRLLVKEELNHEYFVEDFTFNLSGIKIHDLNSGKDHMIKIKIYRGVVLSYYCKVSLDDLDNNYFIDTSYLKESEPKKIENGIISKYFKNLPSKSERILDLEDSFEFEPNDDGFVLHMIKDFENGDMLAIDNEGRVYGAIHDPFIIEKIFDSVEEFLEALESGKFVPEDYYGEVLKR